MSGDQDKLEAAAYFIQSSPPGQLDKVIEDVKIIVNDDALLDKDALVKMAAAYNIEHMVAAEESNGNKVSGVRGACIKRERGNRSGTEEDEKNTT